MMTGWLIDWYSGESPIKNYTPGIIVSIVLLLADLLVAFKIDVIIYFTFNSYICIHIRCLYCFYHNLKHILLQTINILIYQICCTLINIIYNIVLTLQ